MSRSGTRFVPSVDVLETRDTPSGVSGRITGVAVDPAPGATIPAGSVRFIVDGPQVDAAADGRKFKMLVAPLILELDGRVGAGAPTEGETASGRTVRHRFFSIVDRTQLADGVVILTSSLPGGGSSGAGEDRVILTGPVGEFTSDPSRAGDGTITFYDLNGSVVAVALTALDPSAGAAAGQNVSPRPTILLQRLANPGVPGGESGNVYAVWLTVGFFNGPGSRDSGDAGAENGAVAFYLIVDPDAEGGATTLQGALLIARQQARPGGGNDSIWIDLGFPVRHAGTEGQIDRPGTYSWAYLIRMPASTPADPLTFANDGHSSGL